MEICVFCLLCYMIHWGCIFHAYPCISMHIHAYSCIFMHIHAYSMHIHAYEQRCYNEQLLGQKQKGLRFLVSVRVTSDLFNLLRNDVQLQPKLLESIGILPRCVLNDFFHIGVWTFARFVRPLLATILCVWQIWSVYTGITYFTGWPKKN